MNDSVTVPASLYAKLERAAQTRGLTVAQLLTELSQPPPPPAQSAALRALNAGGFSPVSLEAFADLIDPDVDYEAVRRDLARKHFSPSLSETLLTVRG